MDYILTDDTLWFAETIAESPNIESLIEEWEGDRLLLKQSFKWITNSSSENLPMEAKEAIEQFINDTYPSECRRCGCTIPLEERIAVRENDGLCGYCINQIVKESDSDKEI